MTETGVAAIVWHEPAPTVLKKLLVADADWAPRSDYVGIGAAQLQGLSSAPSRPAPRNATLADVAAALNVPLERLQEFIASVRRGPITEEDAQADLEGRPRPSRAQLAQSAANQQAVGIGSTAWGHLGPCQSGCDCSGLKPASRGGQ